MRLSLVLIILLANTALEAAPIRVMTFNIRYDGGAKEPRGGETPWTGTAHTDRGDMVLQVIREVDPDLLALQEALPHQVDEVLSQCPQYGVYSVGRDDGERAGEHCSILFRAARFEQSDAGTFWLSESPSQPGSKYPAAACPRIASWVRLQDRADGGRGLLVVNTHWDHVSQAARQFAAGAIADRVSKIARDGRTILVGDLNATSDSPELTRLLSDHRLPLVDAYRLVHPEKQPNEATVNGFEHRTFGERIDYVLHSRHFTPSSARIVRTTVDDKNPSDHYPVVVELDYTQ